MLRPIPRILLTSAAIVAAGLIGTYIGFNQASELKLIHQPAAECEPVVPMEPRAI
ncbi:hypothetical protein FBY03_11194 [Pseudomonas sp. SJZ079]|uniref:hypothetical protein n=1 Tax=Pseudomonas sp. SJZ079 TaxID=2572887 RepID=UPI00119BA2D2|nr:hypothetical protein [Pseudomonas sp. SJZ079]TWC35046.1 hypothetical protein FBY03_11194 [Pseudomonas sp. SJZ079]